MAARSSDAGQTAKKVSLGRLTEAEAERFSRILDAWTVDDGESALDAGLRKKGWLSKGGTLFVDGGVARIICPVLEPSHGSYVVSGGRFLPVFSTKGGGVSGRWVETKSGGTGRR